LIVLKKSNIIKSQPDPVLKTMTRKGKSLTWFTYKTKFSQLPTHHVYMAGMAIQK